MGSFRLTNAVNFGLFVLTISIQNRAFFSLICPLGRRKRTTFIFSEKVALFGRVLFHWVLFAGPFSLGPSFSGYPPGHLYILRHTILLVKLESYTVSLMRLETCRSFTIVIVLVFCNGVIFIAVKPRECFKN